MLVGYFFYIKSWHVYERADTPVINISMFFVIMIDDDVLLDLKETRNVTFAGPVSQSGGQAIYGIVFFFLNVSVLHLCLLLNRKLAYYNLEDNTYGR